MDERNGLNNNDWNRIASDSDSILKSFFEDIDSLTPEQASLRDELLANDELERYRNAQLRFDAQKAYLSCKPHKGRVLYHYVRGIACSVALVLGLCTYLFYDSFSEDANSSTSTVAKSNTDVCLTLSNGDVVKLGKSHANLVDDSGIPIVADSMTLRYENIASTKKEIAFNQLEVPRGGQYMVVLSDGTKVWLNSSSSLKYPTHFVEDVRMVYLQGEAYFEVSKDSTKRFIVRTGRGDITVYGTEFNVKSYSEENFIRATLVKGSISFSSEQVSEIPLTPGYKLTLKDGERVPKVEPAKIQDEISWKYDKLSFDNYSLEEIMNILSRWYNITVIYESQDLKSLYFSGSMDKYGDIDQFIHLFEANEKVTFLRGDKVIKVLWK